MPASLLYGCVHCKCCTEPALNREPTVYLEREWEGFCVTSPFQKTKKNKLYFTFCSSILQILVHPHPNDHWKFQERGEGIQNAINHQERWRLFLEKSICLKTKSVHLHFWSSFLEQENPSFKQSCCAKMFCCSRQDNEVVGSKGQRWIWYQSE